jgi:hypothetical protein
VPGIEAVPLLVVDVLLFVWKTDDTLFAVDVFVLVLFDVFALAQPETNTMAANKSIIVVCIFICYTSFTYI